MDIQRSHRPSALPWVDSQDVVQVLDMQGNPDPARDPKLDRELARSIYRGMVRTRLIDDRLTKLQRQGRIGFHVGALGEEATIVASAAAMREQDWLFPCYREVGAALYRGLPLQTYMDNMYGNADDVCKGRQMPDHVTGRDAHFVSITAPIGTQLTQAVGFAWAARIKREDTVVGVYFGDGATSSNDFHSAMTFAGVFGAPAVFLLRNNGWAISLPSDKQTAARTYADKGVGYGVPAVRCDGNDVLAVYRTVSEAVARASRGEGPTLIEMMTYRAGAHSTSDDPSAYRTEDQEQLERDPILRMRRYLDRQKAWSDAEERALTEEVQRELRACIEQAEAAAVPTIETMFEQVYDEMPPHLQEQMDECVNGPRAKKKH